jgi:hypothetical protein
MNQMNAQWIWLGHPSYDLVNSWMQARRTFKLTAIPKQAVIRVTADSRYRLYINGVHINRGPARGFQASWPYDTLDIASYLKKGKNVIAVLVHNYGIGTFQYIHQGFAGLLVWGKVGKLDISTDNQWRMRSAPGYKRLMTRVSLQLGFQEHFDARIDDGTWLRLDYNDSDWLIPHCRNFGSMPWYSLEERGIPFLREEILLPKEMVSVKNGKCNTKYIDAPDIATLFCQENHRWIKPNTNLRFSKDWISLETHPTGKDNYFAYCFDFGKEVTGSIRLKVEGADGNEIIDTLVCEYVDGIQPIFIQPDKNWGRMAYGNRLFLRKGKTEHEQFEYWGFRYLVLIVRNSKKRLKINLRLQWVGYPLEVKAEFHSSNQMLNKIYEISAWTQQCCMFDAYVDCPWREQAQWWGDARIQAGNTFYLSADARLLKRGIKQIGTQELPNGLSYGHAPTIAHECILPDFTLVWLLTHWDYYWQTGDIFLFKGMQARIHRALNYFSRATAKNGLLPYDKRYWLFLDWTGLFKEGYSTLYNLLYLMALRKAIELFRLLGDQNSVRVYRTREKALKKAIEKLLFNQKTRTFSDGLHWDTQPVNREAPHVLAYAILLDLFPEEHPAFCKKLVRLTKKQNLFSLNLKPANFIPDKRIIPSPYFMYYIFEALKKCKENETVVDCIARWWGDMVQAGLTTTAEVWQVDPGNSSLCHAWSAHPVIHLSNILLGINQTNPAWKEIIFSPTFTHADSVRGKVATPLGVIESGWKKADRKINVYLSLPKGITAKVVLPNTKPFQVKGSYTAEFSSKDAM